MKSLVTGVTGFVGSYLAEALDGEIHGLKRWRSSTEHIKHLPNLILHDCDITDLSAVISVLRAVQPDRIYHLAAQSFVPFSYSNPRLTLETNIIGTSNILEGVRLLGQNPFIHICSSSEVYGQPLYTPIDEKHPLNPISPYGVSKLAEDRLGYAYFRAYGMKIVITRMFTHTGPRQHDVFFCSNFARQIAAIEKGSEPLVRVGNLDSIRTVCDVRDTVKGYLLLSETMAGQVFNIGGTMTRRVGDILSMLISLSKRKDEIQIETDEDRLRPADVTLQIPDTGLFSNLTGWVPHIPLMETLELLLDYWRVRV